MGFSDLGSGIGGTIGSYLAWQDTQSDRDGAARMDNEATEQFRHLHPEIAAQEAQAQQAGPSAYANIHVDPQTRAMQLEALGQLRQTYQAGGMDAQARADTYAAQQQANQNATAQQANVRNQMAQRGLASSGANFAAQRQAAQSAANQASMAGMQALANGQQRQMGALTAGAGLAGQVRAGDYGQAADRAGAQDAISRFNAGLSTQNSQFNANQRQNAQQQTYNNSYGQAAGVAGSLNHQADGRRNNAKQMQQFYTGMGEAGGGALGGIGDIAAKGGMP